MTCPIQKLTMARVLAVEAIAQCDDCDAMNARVGRRRSRRGTSSIDHTSTQYHDGDDDSGDGVHVLDEMHTAVSHLGLACMAMQSLPHAQACRSCSLSSSTRLATTTTTTATSQHPHKPGKDGLDILVIASVPPLSTAQTRHRRRWASRVLRGGSPVRASRLRQAPHRHVRGAPRPIRSRAIRCRS